MDPRYDGRERAHSSHSQEGLGRRNVRMPQAPNPGAHQPYHPPSDPDAHDAYGAGPPGNPYHYDQQPHHDYGFDVEEHAQTGYHEQYQTTPQDIPLLERHSPQPQPYYDPLHDPLHPDNDEHQPLQYQASHETLKSRPGLVTHTTGISLASGAVSTDQVPQAHMGNLVYDCPVPPKLLKDCRHITSDGGRDEFTHMRYTAATCDPADFMAERFTLRQQLFGKPRRTELMIVVTMYNEEDDLFARTMFGVFQNIEYMCSLEGQHKGLWDKNGWKNIVVVIVSDGRAKINARTRSVLTALGAYQHGVARQKVNDKKVTSHIYEYTTKVGIQVKKGIVETRPGMEVPVQLLFCLKEENQKKINSHRWALQAFGEALQPSVVVLLDAGTRPGKDSIYQLWRAFELNPKCGGACGEIKAMLQGGKKLLNPLVATQNFEYKMSNILDKPMESAFGFISVLPGAFSAYRFIALQNDKKGEGPLEKYFDGEKHHLDAGIFTKNMYLAEDRILCFELVAKRNSSWVLTYVCSASGETDVPEEMVELIKQRRRWLNGSFFAAVYALVHFYQIFRSAHSMLRKIMFLVEFAYQAVSMIFSWFAVGNFFLVFRILTVALGDDKLLGKTGQYLSVICEWIYLASLVTCFVLSLGNTPDGSRRFYMSMVYTWGAIMLYLLFASVFISIKSVQEELGDGEFQFSDLVKNSIFFTMIVSLLSTYILWIFVSIIFLDPWHIVTSSLQYMLLTPTYTNVINVYAFCNTHDVTWGTKGDDKPPPELAHAKIDPKTGEKTAEPGLDNTDLDILYSSALTDFSTTYTAPPSKPNARDVEEGYNKAFRSYVVLVWMFCNAGLVAVVLNVGGLNRLNISKGADHEASIETTYLKVILWSVAGLSFFKFVGAMYYKVQRIFRR
ncbi:chitin synthase 1 [Amylocarpus encephaloides]|uniref:Chitin synthase n=1 Tax=Amylocarpus encephaloides TaxID=45428 RepID=A0A9P7YP13_9HELO|nr:chitin synthase 1 [Amylocarpus encephaloides]